MKLKHTDCEIKIFDDKEKLNIAAAEMVVRLVGQKADKFSIVLSGGSTPKSLYELLASEKFQDAIRWQKVLIFFGDERCVAPDDKDSNFRMANEALLSKINIPQENIFRLRGEIQPVAAAAEYEEKIISALGKNPRFDLVLLGLGDDGHTASLFPETEALKENERLVTANYVEKLSAARLTLTFPAINAAKNILFLITGENKSEVAEKILSEKLTDFPAAKVCPTDGKCFWFLDDSAAKSLVSEMSA